MLNLKSMLQSFKLKDTSREAILNGCTIPPQEFKELAQSALAGAFIVRSGDQTVKIRPTCVEFYYHEEEEHGIKDPIVYHKNPRKGPAKDIFPIGVLHNHVSGIDITFEHGDCPEKAIRASMLIREFEVNGEKDNRSTKLYDWLYSQGTVFDGISVEWLDGENPVRVISDIRKNVAAYDAVENKIPASEANGRDLTSDKKYVQDLRRWQFKTNE